MGLKALISEPLGEGGCRGPSGRAGPLTRRLPCHLTATQPALRGMLVAGGIVVRGRLRPGLLCPNRFQGRNRRQAAREGARALDPVNQERDRTGCGVSGVASS